jgi:hypothetical protein
MRGYHHGQDDIMVEGWIGWHAHNSAVERVPSPTMSDPAASLALLADAAGTHAGQR